MSQQPRVAIVTDSTSDLTPEIADRYGITVVPLNVHFGDNVLRDQVDISTDEFMTRMATSGTLPTTSQPAVGVFESAFRDLAQTHDHIVCVTISSKLSGTYQSAHIAAENVTDSIAVELVDSLNVSLGLGFQAITAARLADQGMNAAPIADRLRAEVNRYYVLFLVETLEHLRRGGRIGKAQQLVGNMLKLKPLLRVDEGAIVPFERTRTRRKAIEALVAFAQSCGPAEMIGVMYNTTPDDAHALADQLRPLLTSDDLFVAQLGPVIDAHIGPDVIGLMIKGTAGG